MMIYLVCETVDTPVLAIELSYHKTDSFVTALEGTDKLCCTADSMCLSKGPRTTWTNNYFVV